MGQRFTCRCFRCVNKGTHGNCNKKPSEFFKDTIIIDLDKDGKCKSCVIYFNIKKDKKCSVQKIQDIIKSYVDGSDIGYKKAYNKIVRIIEGDGE